MFHQKGFGVQNVGQSVANVVIRRIFQSGLF